jgi:hypothetical protein
VSDGNSPPLWATRKYHLTVNLHPTIVGLDLPDCTMGTYYHEALVLAGGTAPTGWALVVGELPAGLTLDTETGVISGTPVESKPAKSTTYVFQVEVIDGNGAMDSEEFSLTLHPSQAESCDGSEVPPTGTPTLTVERSGIYAVLSWTSLAEATAYDVVVGNPALLHDTGGDFGVAAERCLADDRTTTSLAVAEMPSPGSMFFFLVRGVNCAGGGSYDSEAPGQTGFRDAGIEASGSACP